MISPIAVVTEGLINRSPLAMTTNGFLGTGEIVIKIINKTVIRYTVCLMKVFRKTVES